MFQSSHSEPQRRVHFSRAGCLHVQLQLGEVDPFILLWRGILFSFFYFFIFVFSFSKSSSMEL